MPKTYRMAGIKAANSQYSDFTGTVAVDYWDSVPSKEFYKAAKRCNIDLTGWDVVAYAFRKSTLRGQPPCISVYAVKQSTLGVTFEEKRAYADTHNGTVPIREFLIEVSADEFVSWFKEFNVVLCPSEHRRFCKRFRMTKGSKPERGRRT